MTEWKTIEEFPNYEVSEEGEVRNAITGRRCRASQNQFDVMYVGFSHEGVTTKRSLPLIVAKAFLPEPTNPNFDTPINVDGDRRNNHVENLMWRPRWFAVKYHRQFKEGHQPRGYWHPIVEEESGDKFNDSMHAAVTFGLLSEEVMYSVINGTYVFPTFQYFREWEE